MDASVGRVAWHSAVRQRQAYQEAWTSGGGCGIVSKPTRAVGLESILLLVGRRVICG